MTVANGPNARGFDAGTRRILEELRDLRVEMRKDRRRSDDARQRSDERFERMMTEFREDSARREAETRKALKDFGGELKDLRRDMRGVGFAMVKGLNRNTRILEHIKDHHGRLLEHISQNHGRLLERIDRKLGARSNGRPGQGNGRGA